ncbi:Uclacyanin 1 [Glycine max]|nr:Uclacyanin 1 [Glycine max]
MAEQHVVGGSQGWDESTDFNSWVSGRTFMVGDQRVFKYSSLHSVVELGSESEYKNCNIGNAVNSMSSGNDPTTRYFACGTMGHCDQGMKVKITTVSSSGTSSPSSPSLSSAASASASSSSLVFIAALLIASMLNQFWSMTIFLVGLHLHSMKFNWP